MSSLLEHVTKRIEAACALTNAGVDSIQKSLRAYTTQVHPMLQERLSHHLPGQTTGEVVFGRTWTYTRVDNAMSGSRLLNYILQPFYQQEQRPNEEIQVIYLKLSRKSPSDDPSLCVREAAELQLAAIASQIDEPVVRFEDIVTSLLSCSTANSLLESFNGSLVSQQIQYFLNLHHSRFPFDARVETSGRSLDLAGLSMQTRYYESRDDSRAFCVDSNLMRSLAGCMLHRLIVPKDKKVRSNLHYTTLLRYPHKDMLDLSVLAPRDDECTILIIGDISNFTGSLANAWLMLYCMALDINTSNLRERRNLFCVGSTLISASWLHIIAVYLHTTVGGDVFVEDRQNYAFLPGGYLGVAANITVGLLFLCASMQYTIDRVAHKCVSLHAQAGGDDHAFVFTCHTLLRDEVVEMIRSDMSRYVGFLKEFAVYDISNTNSQEVLKEATFCQKRVLVKRDGVRLLIRSEPTVPLPPDIMPTVSLSPGAQIKVFYNLVSCLEDYANRWGDPECICDSILYCYLRRYPGVRAVIYSTRKGWKNTVILHERCGYLMTLAAEEICDETVPWVSTSDFYALHSEPSRIQYALYQELVVMDTADVGGVARQILRSSGETGQRLFTRTRMERWLTLRVDQQVIDSLNL